MSNAEENLRFLPTETRGIGGTRTNIAQAKPELREMRGGACPVGGRKV